MWLGAALALAAGLPFSSVGLAAAPGPPVVTEAAGEVRFERKCANADPFRVQAYAALRSADGRARVLGNVYARRDPVRVAEVFVGMSLVAVAVDGGPAWARAPVSMRLEARSGPRRIGGPERGAYHFAGRRGMAERPFRADADGRLSWLDFVEPPDRDSDADRFHHLPPALEFTATQLGLSDVGWRVGLDLAILHGGTDAAMRLAGPVVWIPERVWGADARAPRALGLLDTLNPAEKGGLWGALTDGFRYRHCIDERRSAKRWFLDRTSGHPPPAIRFSGAPD